MIQPLLKKNGETRKPTGLKNGETGWTSRVTRTPETHVEQVKCPVPCSDVTLTSGTEVGDLSTKVPVGVTSEVSVDEPGGFLGWLTWGVQVDH